MYIQFDTVSGKVHPCLAPFAAGPAKCMNSHLAWSKKPGIVLSSYHSASQRIPGKLVSDLSVGIFVYCSLFETVSYGSKAFSLLSFVSLL
jgi:hypothetical protein